ncbi:transcription factor btf3 [Ceratobasidium sp. AG-Ba]|nr:transcription factor btf3 [Ceratobasidium sp. AG-Ba]
MAEPGVLSLDAPQPDRPQPVAHANEGKDIEQVVDPKRVADNTGHSENGDGWLLCGPMLKYSRLSDESKRWHGSVLILRAPDEEVAKHPDEPSMSLDAPDSNTKPALVYGA